MSLPNKAAVVVNWEPVNWIPSPESPANRITTSVFISVVELIVKYKVTLKQKGFSFLGKTF
jgi:hypothetical protein